MAGAEEMEVLVGEETEEALAGAECVEDVKDRLTSYGTRDV